MFDESAYGTKDSSREYLGQGGLGPLGTGSAREGDWAEPRSARQDAILKNTETGVKSMV